MESEKINIRVISDESSPISNDIRLMIDSMDMCGYEDDIYNRKLIFTLYVYSDDDIFSKMAKIIKKYYGSEHSGSVDFIIDKNGSDIIT